MRVNSPPASSSQVQAVAEMSWNWLSPRTATRTMIVPNVTIVKNENRFLLLGSRIASSTIVVHSTTSGLPCPRATAAARPNSGGAM